MKESYVISQQVFKKDQTEGIQRGSVGKYRAEEKRILTAGAKRATRNDLNTGV